MWITLRVAILAALLGAAAANASVPDVIGLGARSAALAGAGAADASGYEATWLNPAGLVERQHTQLTVGWVQGAFALRLDGAAHPLEATSGALIGIALPLPFVGALKDRLALGAGLFLPRGALNRAKAPYPDVPRFALLETRTQVVSALASISLRVTPRLSLGLGLSALATLLGEIHLETDAMNRIVSATDERIEWAATPIAGVRLRPLDSLSLGLTARGASEAGYDLEITNSLGNTLPIGVPVLRLAGDSQYDPAQVQLEVAITVRDYLTLMAGATYKRWSAFPLPTENATPHTPAQPATGFHDTLVPRVAAEVALAHSLLLRAGYLYERSPAPASAPVLLDADRHVFCLGVGVAPGPVQLELFGQWHALAGSSRAQGNYFAGGLSLGFGL